MQASVPDLAEVGKQRKSGPTTRRSNSSGRERLGRVRAAGDGAQRREPLVELQQRRRAQRAELLLRRLDATEVDRRLEAHLAVREVQLEVPEDEAIVDAGEKDRHGGAVLVRDLLREHRVDRRLA